VATREQVRAFLDRPWSMLRTLKDRHNAATIDRKGPDAAFRMAGMLRDYAELMGARPSEADRAADLQAAVDLRRKLDRANRRSRRSR